MATLQPYRVNGQSNQKSDSANQTGPCSIEYRSHYCTRGQDKCGSKCNEEYVLWVQRYIGGDSYRLPKYEAANGRHNHGFEDRICAELEALKHARHYYHA